MISTESIVNSFDPSPDEKGLPNYRQELLRRIRLATEISRSRRLADLEVELCRRNPSHFVNNWVWTFDPRVFPANLPFRTFDFQDELLSWIGHRFTSRENGLVEKSRDVGASWTFLAWFLHSWIFRRGFFGRLGSRKEELVDDGTEDSLFGKLRYMLDRLPFFLVPSTFLERKHSTYLFLDNPTNGNKIVGESTNADFGRGGRSSAALLDEGASIPHSEKVLSAINNNSNSVFWLSSPKGKDNAFYRLRHNTKIPVLSLHWSRDPRKDPKWYEAQKEILLPWEVGQELDLSYEVETGQKIYTRFQRNWHVAKENIEANPAFEQWRAWDFGHGVMALIWGQITPENIVQIYQTWEIEHEDIEFCIPIAKGFLPPSYVLRPQGEQKTIRDAIKKVLRHDGGPFPLYRDYGDHAGTARTANSKRSCKALLEDKRIDLITSGKQTYDWRFRCTDRLLRLRPVDVEKNVWKSRFQVSPDCIRFIDCMNNYINSKSAINRGEVAPVINWASHQVTAFEFFCINRFPVKSLTPTVREETFR